MFCLSKTHKPANILVTPRLPAFSVADLTFTFYHPSSTHNPPPSTFVFADNPSATVTNTIITVSLITTVDMGNGALQANGFTNTSTTNNHITTHGSDWYWAVCAVMTVSTFAFIGLAFTKHRSQRLFHYITAAITMVAAIAYFSMASNLGWTAIRVEFPRTNPKVSGDLRQIFYVRYIDWFITTPLLLMVSLPASLV